MKTSLRVLQVCLIAAILWGLALLSLAVTNAVGQGSPPSNPYYKILDDFNTSDTRPCYAGNGGWIQSPCPIIDNSYVEMTYSVLPPTSHAWLPINLSGMDLSGWGSVWIVIKGETGGEEVAAEFADCNEKVFPKEKISQYLSGGITTDWRAVAIPLSAFTEISDWSCLSRFSIVANSDLPSGNGTVYVDEVGLLASTVLIDDFHDQEFKNELSGASGPWSTPPAVITTTFPNGVLKLSYNVPNGEIGGGYWTKLFATNLLLQKDHLVFNVRGEQGGEEISAQFIDCGTNGYTHYVEIKASDYLEEGITTTWHTATIPLVAFVDVQSDTDEGVDWSCIEQLAFNVTGRPQYGNGQGTVYIDDVRLISANIFDRFPLWVDHFNDCDDWNALSWKWYSQVSNGAVFTVTPDPVNRRGNRGCGYRFTFDVKVGQSAWAYTELKGLDVTDYFYLEFYIKGKEGGESTNVYLRDLTKKEFPVGIVATDTWQPVRILLSEFESNGVNLRNLSEVKFAYEEGFRKGEVYVDDISFMPPWAVALPLIVKEPPPPPPTKLYITAINTGGIDPVEIRDPNDGDRLLLSCVITKDGPDQFCGSFPPVVTYTIIVHPANCDPAQKMFHDATPGAEVTLTVKCG